MECAIIDLTDDPEPQSNVPETPMPNGGRNVSRKSNEVNDLEKTQTLRKYCEILKTVLNRVTLKTAAASSLPIKETGDDVVVEGPKKQKNRNVINIPAKTTSTANTQAVASPLDKMIVKETSLSLTLPKTSEPKLAKPIPCLLYFLVDSADDLVASVNLNPTIEVDETTSVPTKPPTPIIPIQNNEVNQESWCKEVLLKHDQGKFFGFTRVERRRTACCPIYNSLIQTYEKSIRTSKKSIAKLTRKSSLEVIHNTDTLPSVSKVISQVNEKMRHMKENEGAMRKDDLQAKLSTPTQALKLIKEGLELIQTWSVEADIVPKKRGRKKKVVEVEKLNKVEVHKVPKKRGRKKKIVEVEELITVDIKKLPKMGKRNRKAVEVEELMKTVDKKEIEDDAVLISWKIPKIEREETVQNDNDDDLLFVNRVEVINENGNC